MAPWEDELDNAESRSVGGISRSKSRGAKNTPLHMKTIVEPAEGLGAEPAEGLGAEPAEGLETDGDPLRAAADAADNKMSRMESMYRRSNSLFDSGLKFDNSKSSYQLDPNSNFKRGWDIAQAVILVYIALVVPFR